MTRHSKFLHLKRPSLFLTLEALSALMSILQSRFCFSLCVHRTSSLQSNRTAKDTKIIVDEAKDVIGADWIAAGNSPEKDNILPQMYSFLLTFKNMDCDEGFKLT